MSSHSPYSPSGSKRWLNCSGSVALEAAHPDEGESSVYAREGSAAHLLGELRLKRILTAVGLTQTEGKQIREIAPNLNPKEHDYLNIRVTEEMIWCVQQYVIFVESQLPPGASPLNPEYCAVEQRVTTAIDKRINGTMDAGVNDWPMTLHVNDLKYGAGYQVEAEGNSQLAIYGLGAIEHFGSDFETIKMSIFQPRGAGEMIRTWEMPLTEFKEEWTEIITTGFNRIFTEPDTYTPGEWCKWCRGAAHCPQARGGFNTALAQAHNSAENAVMTVEQLGHVLRLETAVLEYLRQCKATAFELITKGVPVPGQKIVKTWGREKWTNEKQVTEELVQLGFDGIEISELTNIKFKTPKQIRTALKSDYPEVLDKLTTTPFNGLKLVPETDKRPAYSGAAEAFAELPAGE
jgi:hypothetical protein